MKRDKIIFWISTSLIFLMDAVIPALTSHTDMAVEGIKHLGFPDYFRVQLTVFKVIGGIILIIPAIPSRVKEWAYVGFAINFISACIAHWVVDGFGAQTIFPIVALLILNASYVSFHRLQSRASGLAQLSYGRI